MADPRQDLVRALGVEAARATPPTMVALYASITRHLPEFVGFATLIYIVLQAGHLAWRWWCQWHDRRRAIAAKVEPPPFGDEPA